MNISDRIKASIRAFSASTTPKLSQKDLGIIQQIVGEYKDRSRKHIQAWRDNVQMAEDVENPRWYAMQDLYDDTTDAHLMSIIDIRKMSTTSHRFYVIDKKSGEQLLEQTNLLDKEWFFDFIDAVQDAIFYKYNIIQVLKNGDVPTLSLLPRRNVCPQFKRIYTEVSGDKFIDYSTQTDVVEVQHRSSFGIVNDIMPNVIWKKNAMQAWAEFGERFGMPLITATTANKNDIPRIEAMLKQMGEAAQGILPTGTTVQLHEMSSSNSNGVYDGQLTFHDAQMSKRILGGTMVSDDGSSRSQSEVHERTSEKIATADKRFIRFVVNGKLFPVLQRLGFPINPETMDFQFDETEELSLLEHWSIVNQAADKYELDDQWVGKTFNIPIIKRKENAPSTPINFNPAIAMGAVAMASQVRLPEYETCEHCLPTASSINKSLLDQLNGFDEQIAHYLYKEQTSDAERERLLKGKAVGESLRNMLFDGWGDDRLSVDWNAPDNRCLAAMEMNLFQFSEAKGRAEVMMLNQLLIDKEKLNIRSEADFIEEAKKINQNFNETYLSVERDFALAVGQNSARYMEFIREKNDIDTWQYHTVGDSHVRPEHQALDGRVFKFDDKEARSLFPPNGYRCRCEGIQSVEHSEADLMSGKQGVNLIFPTDKLKEQFAVNRAETGEVFCKNQIYINQLDGNTQNINSYTYKDYGLKPWSELKPSLDKLRLDATITPENVDELFVDDAGKYDYKAMGFEDYLKRKLVLKEKAFKQHTKGKYVKESENRHRLFPHIAEILKEPSEVLLREKEKENQQQIRFIKFYKDKALIVDTSITEEHLEIKTWYAMKANEQNIRTGLLIK
ncbi:MAG: DUF935 family protein [Bacteroidales bacterium]